MALEAKTSLLNQIEKEIGSNVTFDAMPRIMSAIADVLQSFDVIETSLVDPGSDDLLACYLDALKVQGRSQKTVDRYAYVIGRMMQNMKVPTRQITVYHLRGYLSAEKSRGISDSTLEGTREVLSAYFNWLHRESLIDKNPTANLGAIKVPKRQKKIFSEVDREKIDRCCISIRDRAIIYFLRATGCRISEAMNLNRDQIDLTKRRVTVIGKGDKERIVFFDDLTGLLLQEYFEERKDNDPALFVGRYGERLQPNGVRVMMRKLEAQAGVDHIHPHKFRRTLATNLARHGMPVQEVAAVLGHDKLDTTMEYVNLDENDTEYSYRRYNR